MGSLKGIEVTILAQETINEKCGVLTGAMGVKSEIQNSEFRIQNEK